MGAVARQQHRRHLRTITRKALHAPSHRGVVGLVTSSALGLRSAASKVTSKSLKSLRAATWWKKTSSLLLALKPELPRPSARLIDLLRPARRSQSSLTRKAGLESRKSLIESRQTAAATLESHARQIATGAIAGGPGDLTLYSPFKGRRAIPASGPGARGLAAWASSRRRSRSISSRWV